MGQKVFQTTLELVTTAGVKGARVASKSAFTAFVSEGGFRHAQLERMSRFPYLDMDGDLRGINVRLGPSFEIRQLQLMKNWKMFSLMLAVHVRCDSAMIRFDSVHWLNKSQTAALPRINSTLVTVRKMVCEDHNIGPDPTPQHTYWVSIGGGLFVDPFIALQQTDDNNNPNSELAMLLRGADFAQVFVPTDYGSITTNEACWEKYGMPGAINTGSTVRRFKTDYMNRNP